VDRRRDEQPLHYRPCILKACGGRAEIGSRDISLSKPVDLLRFMAWTSSHDVNPFDARSPAGNNLFSQVTKL
jgi:hypothetical protein